MGNDMWALARALEVQQGAIGELVPIKPKASGLRLERCAASGDLAHGHGHLCLCGQMFSAPAGAEGGPWVIPEHDGECSC